MRRAAAALVQRAASAGARSWGQGTSGGSSVSSCWDVCSFCCRHRRCRCHQQHMKVGAHRTQNRPLLGSVLLPVWTLSSMSPAEAAASIQLRGASGNASRKAAAGAKQARTTGGAAFAGPGVAAAPLTAEELAARDRNNYIMGATMLALSGYGYYIVTAQREKALKPPTKEHLVNWSGTHEVEVRWASPGNPTATARLPKQGKRCTVPCADRSLLPLHCLVSMASAKLAVRTLAG